MLAMLLMMPLLPRHAVAAMLMLMLMSRLLISFAFAMPLLLPLFSSDFSRLLSPLHCGFAAVCLLILFRYAAAIF